MKEEPEDETEKEDEINYFFQKQRLKLQGNKFPNERDLI